jgi:choline dehydrogenase-like flavoprotein
VQPLTLRPSQDQFLSSIVPAPSTGKYFTIITGVISSASVGNVTLNSSSPFDAPIINLNALGQPWDVAMMREGVKKAVRAANSKSLQNAFILAPYGPLADVINAGLTDDAIDQYVQGNTTIALHSSCSARMTKVNGTDGVVDPWLRVQGTVGLRVVDASAFVSSFSRHIATWSC